MKHERRTGGEQLTGLPLKLLLVTVAVIAALIGTGACIAFAAGRIPGESYFRYIVFLLCACAGGGLLVFVLA